MNIAILASGTGTNFTALAKAVKRGYIKAKIKLLITDKETAPVRKRARKLKIKELFINPKKIKSRLDFDITLAKILNKEKIDLIILAGYMRVLSPDFTRKFRNKILNIHPAILPAFRGINAIEKAFRYGCKITGVTIHFVDEYIDHGPVIMQKSIEIDDNMTLKELKEKVHKLEHKLYPLAVKLIVEKRIKVKKRNVKIA